MADTTITPPAQVTIVAAGGQQTQNATEANTTHASLQQGATVSGTIVGKDNNGNFLLKSPQGTLTLRSITPLTYNSDVTIRIGAGTAGSTNARIVSVNGEPFSEFSAPEPTTSDSVSTSLLTQVAQTPEDTSPNPTTNLRALVTSAPPATPEQNSPALTTGASVIVRIPQTATSETLTQQSQSPSTEETQPTQSNTPAASVASSATVETQPQQTAQVAVPAATPPATPSQPVAIATTAGTPVAAATAAPIETELAPAQTVTQIAQPQQPQGQQPQPQVASPTTVQQPVTAQQTQQATSQAAVSQAQAAASGLPNAPTAPVAALYNVYAKQAETAAPTTPSGTTSTTSGAPQAASPTAAPATIVPAQITSANEDGTINLQTTGGAITVKTGALTGLSSLAPGTAVLLEIITSEPAQALFDTAPASITELATSWQSLKDIAAATSAESSPASSPLLARLPQLGPDFISESMAFISGLLQGNARKLLGDDTIDTLQQNGRTDLLEKFSGEVSTMSNAYNAPEQREVAGWQMLSLPFVFQEALQQARLYVKREAPKKDRTASKNTADTRFVVEVDLSDLGPMQMDGLVRKQEKTTAFDLIIRSQKPFLPEDQLGIFTIYNGAAQITGFKGSLTFQVTKDFPVKPMEEAGASDDYSIVV